MALQSFRDEQLNYFKFASIVLNEFPKALRQTFRSMWDNTFGHLPGFQPWDDSAVVRNMFLATDGGTTKVPTNLSYDEWDCTALFQATIYARSFALPDSKGHHRTLSDLYVKPHKLPLGSFHVSVVSPGGNKAETFALAIDQLRLLRNSLCHSSSSEIDRPTFDQNVQYAKDAFKALTVKTDLIDVIAGLTESHFPTKEVRKLEQGIREETRAYIRFIEEGTASKEDIARLEQKIDDLKPAEPQDNAETNPSLPRASLPPMAPHFTGRQRECDEITGLVNSEFTRIVSIWGSPGFGKTSVATAVGHHLHSQGLPVYFLSLRGVQSTADLTSKLLSLFRRPATNDQPSQGLSLDDKLFQVLNEISHRFVLILDNADELFESGVPKVKDDFINFLDVILRQNEKVAFVITTRESFEFLNVYFQGHQAVRIRPLDESSSQSLVNELLPGGTPSDWIRITQICRHVPLAMKLLCSYISEDDLKPSQVLDDFIRSLESNNIVEMLDNPDYPSNLRLKSLFDSSFQRLSAQEKEALLSLTVFPESFDLTVAAAVLGISQVSVAKKILHGLRRKSLLDYSAKPGSFSMHKLLESFARERGEHEMKESVLNSKSRLCAFYVSRFEKLNEQFLTGNSMKAFVDFYEAEQSIVQSLIDGCSDPKTANSVFEVLVKAELFLYSLYWRERTKFDKIYNTAIKIAKKLEQNVFYKQLLVSRAFYQVTWITEGATMQQLTKAKEIESSCSPVSAGDKGKHLCYSGICKLVTGNKEDGVRCLEEALSLMNGTPEQRILRIIAFQILAVYYSFEKNHSMMSLFNTEAAQECTAVGDTKLLIITAKKNNKKEFDDKQMENQPMKLSIICLLSEATKHLNDHDSKRIISNTAQKMAKQMEKILVPSSLGLFIFQRNVKNVVKRNKTPHHKTIIINSQEEAVKQLTQPMSCTEESSSEGPTVYSDTQRALSDSNSAGHSTKKNALDIRRKLSQEEHKLRADMYHSLGVNQHKQGDFTSAIQSKQRALDIRRKRFGEEHSSTADSYNSLGVTQHKQGDFTSAIQSKQRALDIRRKLFGEEHSSTAHSYHSLGRTQLAQGDVVSAIQCKQRALDIRRKLFGEEHSKTAACYDSLGDTQHEQGDFTSAIQSKQRALDIRRKLFGEEHSNTAESYHSLGVTQHAQSDFTSAIQSTQRALDSRREIFGDEHSSTADSYHLLGRTQLAQGDFVSAIQSKQRALDIKRKLFGEEHLSTAASYYSLGVTQHKQGDFTSAAQSKQRALDTRRKLFGEEHSKTAACYESLGDTQHEIGDFTSAIQSTQRALDSRRKCFGEEHSSTADSYHSLGVTQHKQGDFTSAIQSKQRALDIRRKLFGEEHSSTADSCHSLGVTQHAQSDFTSAIQSTQRALDIRRKLFGEEHSSTADSYHSLGRTQLAQGDFVSAIQSKRRALDIRRKLFGEEHSKTAACYDSLGDTQHEQGDFTSAIQSKQRALDIRRKLFGEEHSKTAACYDSLGDTQHEQGDFTSAIQSTQCALDIRRKLFGEEHSSTADSYHSLGVTQHKQGDFTSAIQSKQRALDIRRKLFGEEHSSTADSYHSLGRTQLAQNDFTLAVQSTQRALDIKRKLFGEEHLSTAASYHSLGVTQHKQGDFTSAAQSRQRALDIRRKLFGEENSKTAACYDSLGDTKHEQGDFTSAIQCKQRALDIRRKLFGEEHSKTAAGYHSLGVIQHTQGDFTSAIQSFQRALDIRRKLFGKEHKSTADSYRSLRVTQQAVQFKKCCIV